MLHNTFVKLIMQEMSEVPSDCPPEVMDSNDPLFISYTSGSEADPKAIVHTQAGLLMLTAATYRVSCRYAKVYNTYMFL